jgi:hypothetical protein
MMKVYFRSHVDYFKTSPAGSQTQSRLASEILSLGVPDFSRLSSEDVLETRLKLKDELEGFRQYVKQLHDELTLQYDGQVIYEKVGAIASTKVAPALKDITQKLKYINISIPQAILQEIRDPKSYSPLLLSFMGNVPPTISLLASLGFISSKVMIDYLREKGNVSTNGLYYLLKLRQRSQR